MSSPTDMEIVESDFRTDCLLYGASALVEGQPEGCPAQADLLNEFQTGGFTITELGCKACTGSVEIWHRGWEVTKQPPNLIDNGVLMVCKYDRAALHEALVSIRPPQP